MIKRRSSELSGRTLSRFNIRQGIDIDSHGGTEGRCCQLQVGDVQIASGKKDLKLRKGPESKIVM